MRIIKDNTEKEYTCKHCGSIFVASEIEIKKKPMLPSRIFYMDYLECPCCGKDIKLREYEIGYYKV